MKPSTKRYLTIAGLFLFVCCAFLGIGSFLPDDNDTSKINAESPDQLRDAIAGALSSGNRDIPRIKTVEMSDNTVIVRWSINDNITMDNVKRSAMLDIKNILGIINRTDLDYGTVVLEGFYPVDNQETMVVQATYIAETIAQINWDNFVTDNVYNIAYLVEIHPAFTE